MQQLSVLIPAPLECYDYLADTPVAVGTFVEVPFGRKTVIGVVWNQKINKTLDTAKLKKIVRVLPETLPTQSVEFINWVAKYTLSPTGAVLKMALINDMEKKSKKPLVFERPNPVHAAVTFSDEQRQAADTLCQKIDGGFSVCLLDGITGSGKTEVYFEAIAAALTANKGVLILLPEITLTTAFLTRFEKRFGVKPAVWHSALTPKQRRDIWQAVQSGAVSVLVGARSALFLPFSNLGLIVIDEEHDASFKQEDGVLYNARDMAIVRAHIADCPVILASATPSLESYCNALSGKYGHVTLTHRYAGATVPDIQVIDMRQKGKGADTVQFLSPTLRQKIAENLEKGEETLLFINRRGYAPLVLCRACGTRLACPHCSAWLVEHKTKNILQCHHCGYTVKRPDQCPVCGEKALISCGPGVERIYEEVCTVFPTARARMVTSETLNNLTEFQTLLDDLDHHKVDILIGTQLLAKGHNFPDLTLVGVIDADQGLAGGDLRASERTFQMLHQVMGRAGRDGKKGIALLQSYEPENLIIQALQQNNREAFFSAEIQSRQLLGMPPFGKLAGVIVSGKNEVQVIQTAKLLARTFPDIKGVSILGPTPAPISKLRNKFRYRLLIKADKNAPLQKIIAAWMGRICAPSTVSVRLDIDPYSFY